MKALNNLLFVASFFCMSALMIALSGCTKPEKKEPPPATRQQSQQPAPSTPPPSFNRSASVSVDFDNAALSEVAQFVTHQTGKGFILNGSGDKTVSWIEYNIPREKILDSFAATLTAAGLVMKPTTTDRKVFTVDKAEDLQVPYKLNFATSSRGTFFLLGQSVYSREQFPFPVSRDGGHWYAMIPKSLADSLLSPPVK